MKSICNYYVKRGIAVFGVLSNITRKIYTNYKIIVDDENNITSDV